MTPGVGTLLLLLGLGLLHLWMIGSGLWPLSADEAHYWEWSRNLDWSYYSKGPLVAYLIAGSTWLGGQTAFWIRLPAVLLGTALAGLAAIQASETFRNARAGFLTVAVLGVIPLFAAGSLLMTIDPPFVFCWGLAGFCLWRVAARRRAGGWYGAGIAFGVGLLSKYTMLMLLPCVLFWLVGSPRLRPWLRRREPYEALALGFLIFSPVIVWNARHGWLSGRHVLVQAGVAAGHPWPSLLSALEFLGSQIGLVSPLLFFLMLSALVWAGREGLRQGRDELWLLACLSLPVLLFFQAWSLLSKVQGNWAAHAYVPSAIALAGWAQSWQDWGADWQRTRRLKLCLQASIILPAAVLAAFFVLDVGALGLRIPERLDLVSKRLRGWPELGEAVGSVMRTLPRTPFLMSDRYQIASQLAFYAPGQPRVYNVNLGRRMNQYDLWGGWEALRGRDGLFVTFGRIDPPPELRQAFDRVERLRVVPIVDRGKPLRDFSIILGEGFRGFPPHPFAGH
ncbi:MAG: glycosyltransferase family 39 protein [candidate division NC10 bacterium]|nr:glycosyltransferase family 39 protein [candidate division NC10 bacterium]